MFYFPDHFQNSLCQLVIPCFVFYCLYQSFAFFINHHFIINIMTFSFFKKRVQDIIINVFTQHHPEVFWANFYIYHSCHWKEDAITAAPRSILINPWPCPPLSQISLILVWMEKTENVLLKNMDFGNSRPEFEFQLCYLFAMWPWVIYLTCPEPQLLCFLTRESLSYWDK